MKAMLSNALFTFGICLFCGIIIVAIGFGAAFPIISRVAAPISCSGRDLQLSTHSYYPRPGETDTTITWYCVDARTGTKQDVSWQTILASGLIYSFVLFVVAMSYGLVTRLQGQMAGRDPSRT